MCIKLRVKFTLFKVQNEQGKYYQKHRIKGSSNRKETNKRECWGINALEWYRVVVGRNTYCQRLLGNNLLPLLWITGGGIETWKDRININLHVR